MALATLSDAPPGAGDPIGVRPGISPGARPGLAARMSSLASALGAVVADLDPGLLLGSDAASLYGDFCRLERLVTAGKTLLAPRIDESGCWERDGHRSAAGLLATLEGGSNGAARRTLEAGRALADLPGTEAALRQGSLSGPKLAEVTQAGTLDPESEGALLAGIGTQPLSVIKERGQRVRATAAGKDPVATVSRIHALRSFTWWSDAEGAFCYRGRDTPERGAALLARLVPVANRLRSDRRAAATEATPGRPTGSPDPRPEPDVALRADALFLLVTRRSAPPGAPVPPVPVVPAVSADPPTRGSPPTRSTLPTRSTVPIHFTRRPHFTRDAPTNGCADPEDVADVDDLGCAEDLITAVPPATVIVRVDLEALRRGRARPGELCALDGHGPVPVGVAHHLLDDAFLALVFTEAGDIRSSPTGADHQPAPAHRPGLPGPVLRGPGMPVAYGLEIDHVQPLESGGDTRLNNLALLCRHHHRLKTYDGWDLARTGPTDEDPRWCFTPQAPFGQEPDLGLDRPHRTHRSRYFGTEIAQRSDHSTMPTMSEPVAPDDHRRGRRLAGRPARRRGDPPRGPCRPGDHRGRRAPCALRPPPAVQAGAGRHLGRRAHPPPRAGQARHPRARVPPGSPGPALDTEARTFACDDGSELHYDGLIVATGAATRALPGTEGMADVCTSAHPRRLPGHPGRPGRRRAGARVVVIGAGFIGSEVAATCHGLGPGSPWSRRCPPRWPGCWATRWARPVPSSTGPTACDLRCRRRRRPGVRPGRARPGGRGPRRRDRASRPTWWWWASAWSPPSSWLDGSGLTLDNGVVCTRVPVRRRPGGGRRGRGPVDPSHARASRSGWSTGPTPPRVGRPPPATCWPDRPAAAPYDPVPFFWSDQYETKIQMIGLPGRRRRSGRGRGIGGGGEAGGPLPPRRPAAGGPGLQPPRQLMAYRPLLAAGASFDEALAVLILAALLEPPAPVHGRSAATSGARRSPWHRKRNRRVKARAAPIWPAEGSTPP